MFRFSDSFSDQTVSAFGSVGTSGKVGVSTPSAATIVTILSTSASGRVIAYSKLRGHSVWRVFYSEVSLCMMSFNLVSEVVNLLENMFASSQVFQATQVASAGMTVTMRSLMSVYYSFAFNRSTVMVSSPS